MKIKKPVVRILLGAAIGLIPLAGRIFRQSGNGLGWKRWKDAFKIMRENCETDWAQKYPQYAVSTWIGHRIEVSARHYLHRFQRWFKEDTARHGLQRT